MQDFLNDIKWAKTVVEAYKVNNVLKLLFKSPKEFQDGYRVARLALNVLF